LSFQLIAARNFSLNEDYSLGGTILEAMVQAIEKELIPRSMFRKSVRGFTERTCSNILIWSDFLSLG